MTNPPITNPPITNEESITHRRQILRWEEGVSHRETDELAAEEPLEIRVRGRAISVTMRTPGHDDELAAGFLLSEGIIQQRANVLKIEPCDGNEYGNLINVQLAAEVPVDFARLTRHVFASSSCGLCGKATIDAIHERFKPLKDIDIPKTDPVLLATFPQIMRQSQSSFQRTGGLHAAALFSADGKMVVLREDIGRHNAVDKVLGYSLLHGLLPLDQHVLLLSGRSSFEIMQKALAARVPIIAGISAPSALAAQFATENHQTLIGFLRGNRMNIYSGENRLSLTLAQYPGRGQVEGL